MASVRTKLNSLLTKSNNSMINCPKNILLWGGKSQAKLLEGLINDYGLGDVKIVFDSFLESQHYQTGGVYIRSLDELKLNLDNITHFMVAIAAEHGYARCKISEGLIALNKKPLSIFHHTAFLDQKSHIGHGAQIMANVVVNKFAEVGNQVVLNTASVIEHEARIGDGVHVMGGAMITGRVVIEDYCTVGTNAVILPDIRIGRGSLIGAGAVVTKDVEPNSVMIGVPARKIKETELAFDSVDISWLAS